VHETLASCVPLASRCRCWPSSPLSSTPFDITWCALHLLCACSHRECFFVAASGYPPCLPLRSYFFTSAFDDRAPPILKNATLRATYHHRHVIPLSAATKHPSSFTPSQNLPNTPPSYSHHRPSGYKVQRRVT